ncbi:MAG TPA: hypothetical protein VNZ05_01630 [Solirubrobacteraceae bacterium]|jgi:hypothetical protein|nr:hypothetical protein [Solirubrobacteraceae bacterium]
MANARRLVTHRSRAALVIAAALLACFAAAAASAAASARARRSQTAAALRVSPQLWATIDVCSPPHQRYTIGIRGSMPSDGQLRDPMYMRFRLQYVDLTSQRWTDLASADSGFLPVGASHSARQAGRSFVLFAPSGGMVFTLRGVVSFQWRHAGKLLASVSRATSAGHQSLAGADPPNYSAATCRIS